MAVLDRIGLIEAGGREVTEAIELTPADIDGLGHLNQAQYHALLGSIRGKLLRGSFDDEPGHNFVMARTELDHHREVRLEEGHVLLRARIAAIGKKSITLENELIRADGEIAASGRATMVAWDKSGRRSRLVSESERAALDRT
jgi:acyl-CoA thioester hydrolase